MYALIFLPLNISAVEVSKLNQQEYKIHHIEGLTSQGHLLPLGERQKVDLFLRDKNQLDSIFISSTGFTPTDKEYGWKTKEENRKISKPMFDRHLDILYKNKKVFSTSNLLYDYIRFNDVCRAKDGRHWLRFIMIQGGTANGDHEDILYVFYDKKSNHFSRKVVVIFGALSADCDLGSPSQITPD